VSISAFGDRQQRPSAEDLAPVLGPAVARWDALVTPVRGLLGDVAEEWTYAGARGGWPLDRRFFASGILGGKAIQATAHRGLSAEALALLAAAPKCPEGRGIRVPVDFAHDVNVVKALVGVKIG
jgi:hypothetical protein